MSSQRRAVQRQPITIQSLELTTATTFSLWEALLTIDRTVSTGFKRNFTFLVTICAGRLMHFSRPPAKITTTSLIRHRFSFFVYCNRLEQPLPVPSLPISSQKTSGWDSPQLIILMITQTEPTFNTLPDLRLKNHPWSIKDKRRFLPSENSSRVFDCKPYHLRTAHRYPYPN